EGHGGGGEAEADLARARVEDAAAREERDPGAQEEQARGGEGDARDDGGRPGKQREGKDGRQRAGREEDGARGRRFPPGAPELLGVDAELLARERLERGSLVGHDLLRERRRVVPREAFRLVDERQLLLFLLRDLLELGLLDLDLPLVQLARALDRDPFAEG